MTGSAFGVGFRGDPLPGLHGALNGDRMVDVVHASPREIDERWSGPEPASTLYAKRFESGEAFLSVLHREDHGFRLAAQGLGIHLVSDDGRRAWSHLPATEPWLTRKFVAAQLLPLLAVLAGIEVLHAAAVQLDGRVIGLVAASGTGKTSTAARLIGAGAGFVADDGLGLELDGDQVLAHPGPRTLNLAAAQFEAMQPSPRARLGVELGRSAIGDEVEVHIEPASRVGPLPLAGLLYLERTTDAVGGIEPVEEPATTVLGSSHAPYLGMPRRLLRQLDVTSAIVRHVPVAKATIGTREPAERIAERVRSWAGAA